MVHHPPRVLTIAGSDSGGSAGVQADLKTLTALGVFGTSALTLVTAQDTEGVQSIQHLSPEFVAAQVEAVIHDIGADAIKMGFLGDAQVIAHLKAYLPSGMPLVVDPVLVNGASELIVSRETIRAYQKILLPRAKIITPNLDESRLLAGLDAIQNQDDMETAARRIYEEFGPRAIVIKGGHLAETQRADMVLDLLFDGQEFYELSAPRLPISNPHGVGCTFASAIAAYIAKGQSTNRAVHLAHRYLQNALSAAQDWKVGNGRTPVNHFFQQDERLYGN